MSGSDATLLECFMRGELETASFPHREHVRVACAMLQRYEFAEAVLHFSRTLRAMAARAGKPTAFHQTITIAFLALIAERMGCTPHADFASFAAANPDLFDRNVLARWYRPERLATELARSSFVLPDVPHAPS